MSYLQAVVIALVQGVTELFPVSSLGHSVILPAWLGGSWNTLVTQSAQQSSESSFYLAYIVALHVATALALLWFFRADWVRIIGGFLRSTRRSVQERRFTAVGSDERLAWMIILATIPVGITGLALEHVFRTLFAKPVAASVFLFINGLILLWAERTRRNIVRRERQATPAARPEAHAVAMPIAGGASEIILDESSFAAARGGRSGEELAAAYASDVRISRMPYRNSLVVGLMQISALFAGISRDGVTMAGGLWRGLSREDAARFAFLLATPPILAAGLLKLPSLAGHAGAHIHGQVLVGVIVTGITAYVSVRYLIRYFRRGRTLTPFAIYCLIAGGASAIRFIAG
jgi:undecaprenyl-diphosphatase